MTYLNSSAQKGHYSKVLATFILSLTFQVSAQAQVSVGLEFETSFDWVGTGTVGSKHETVSHEAVYPLSLQDDRINGSCVQSVVQDLNQMAQSSQVNSLVRDVVAFHNRVHGVQAVARFHLPHGNTSTRNRQAMGHPNMGDEYFQLVIYFTNVMGQPDFFEIERVNRTGCRLSVEDTLSAINRLSLQLELLGQNIEAAAEAYSE